MFIFVKHALLKNSLINLIYMYVKFFSHTKCINVNIHSNLKTGVFGTFFEFQLHILKMKHNCILKFKKILTVCF